VIPVLIAPAYNRYDLLDRMLRSVSHPVERGLIIDNGRSDYAVPDWVGPEWRLIAPPFTSFGYPGSINLGIMQTPDADWWLWVSNDVVFGSGDLDAIVALMEEATGPRLVSWHFAMGAVNRAMVDAVGLFDEWSFWPLYFDDNDYAWRCHLAGFDVEWYFGNMTEGADGHGESMTIRSDPALAFRNSETWAINKAAYIAKWGGPPGKEKRKTPWGKNLPLWATRPDVVGRRDRLW
jgi:GT2 family glycosyltransferase